MTPEEEVLFTDKLTKQFILIPKGRLYHCIGGALAFIVVALGINIGAVLHYLSSAPAEIANKRIMEIKENAEQYQKDLEAGTFLKINKPYYIRIPEKGYLVVRGQRYSNATPIVFATDRTEEWQFVQAQQ